jgi:hypothetical protein
MHIPSIRPLLLGILLLSAVGLAKAAAPDAQGQVTLAATSRIYVTLVPRSAETDDGPRPIEASSAVRPALNLSLRATRRNRLEFALATNGILTDGDQLKLRLASDAHIVAQLISGGQFSEVDDSWIAVLGLASRFGLSYNNGPWELSLSARRKLGDGNLRARFSYSIRF